VNGIEELKEISMIARDLFMLKRVLERKKVMVAGMEASLDEKELEQIKSVYVAKVKRIKELVGKLDERI